MTKRWIALLLILPLALSLALPALSAEEAEESAPYTETEPLPADELPENPLPGAEPPEETAPPADDGDETPTPPADDGMVLPPTEEEAPADGDDSADVAPEEPAPVSQETAEPAEVPEENVPAEAAEALEENVPAEPAATLETDGSAEPAAEIAADGAAMPGLVTDRHIRYIQGVGNGCFGPQSPLTRAQAATILYNLLTSEERGGETADFPDVADGAWYAEAVRLLASHGVITGYGDGTFRPDRTVTRAEFVTLLARLLGAEAAGDGAFSDVGSHWARSSIAAAAERGWINGYVEDNTSLFRPNNPITRAEAVTVMNRVLGRTADPEALTAAGIRHFLDVADTDWYYAAVMEASIAHEHALTGGKEVWTSFTKETTGLPAGRNRVGDRFCWIDKNGQPLRLTEGINYVSKHYVYAPAAGYTFTADLSDTAGKAVFADGRTQALTKGVNTLGTTTFYWTGKAVKKLTAGFNTLGGKTYYAPAAGYALSAPEKGAVKLGGKWYLAGDACEIITHAAGWYDYDGYSYYFGSGNTIVVGTKKTIRGYSYTFDAKGRLYGVKRSAIEKSATAKKTDQIVLVVDHGLTYWEKAEDGSWRLLLDTYCGYGKNGLTNAATRNAGTLTTPIGSFPLTLAFGTGKNPGTKMTYKQITNNSYWSAENDDTYNTWVESSRAIEGEHLIDYYQYKYALAVGFNIDPAVYGRGSAIFVHCKSTNSWNTAGCLSLAESDMLWLLKRVKNGAYIIIVPDTDAIGNY